MDEVLESFSSHEWQWKKEGGVGRDKSDLVSWTGTLSPQVP